MRLIGIKENLMKNIICFIVILVIITSLMSCSSVYTFTQTECKIEEPSEIAVIAIYESKKVTNNDYEVYSSKELDVYISEFERLGFKVNYINPKLNQQLDYILSSTRNNNFTERANLILKVLIEYPYVFYAQFLDTDKKKEINDIANYEYLLDYNRKSSIEDSTLKAYYTSLKTGQIEVKGKLNKESEEKLKRNILEKMKVHVIDTINKYVKNIGNYKLLLEGSNPDC